MSDLTVVALRAYLETDLEDNALQRLIDDAESEIVKAHGERSTQTDTFTGETLATALFLSRKAVEITTIVEEVAGEETTLAADDYRLRYEGRQIQRLATGTNPRSTWGEVVTVLYEPKDDLERRLRVTIDLVKLAVAYNALDSETVGDYAARSVKYEQERSALLARLSGWSFA